MPRRAGDLDAAFRRRFFAGMMTRNLVLLYAFLMAEFHYKEHSRAREVPCAPAASLARSKAAHARMVGCLH